MLINELKEQHEIIKLFCDLAQIPSPSKQEEKVAEYVKSFCETNKIPFSKDNYGNVIIKIPATDNSKPLLGLSAHMDVIGDDSPINPIIEDEFITAKASRTLGADDKIGVANALYLAKKVVKYNLKHGGLEIVFTRDEESGMSGIENFDFTNLHTQYILVCDADKLGQLLVSGASYTNVKLNIKAHKGGHSGIDIEDKTRPNAAKLIAILCSRIPQGVFYADETGVITSINIGGISGGNLNVTNVINTDACATYSIRSASVQKEMDLKEELVNIIDDFNEEYKEIAVANITFEQHLPPFEKSEDNYIPEVFEKVADKLNVKTEIASFHAGAETHIYAQNVNADNKPFKPFLLGLADVFNMHSAEEKVDYNTIIKGAELLNELFLEFNN